MPLTAQSRGISDLLGRRKRIKELPPVPEPEGGHVFSLIQKAAKALFPDQYNATHRLATGVYEDPIKDALAEASGDPRDTPFNMLSPMGMGAIRQATGRVNPDAFLYSPTMGLDRLRKIAQEGLREDVEASAITPRIRSTITGGYDDLGGLIYNVRDPQNLKYASPGRGAYDWAERRIPTRSGPVDIEEMIPQQGSGFDIQRDPLKELFRQQGRGLRDEYGLGGPETSDLGNSVIYRRGDPKEIFAAAFPYHTEMGEPFAPELLQFAREQKLPLMMLDRTENPQDAIFNINRWLAGDSGPWDFYNQNPFDHPFGMFVSRHSPSGYQNSPMDRFMGSMR